MDKNNATEIAFKNGYSEGFADGYKAGVRDGHGDVIHCNVCQYWKDDVPGCTDHVKCCALAYYMVGENGFCVYGKGIKNG